MSGIVVFFYILIVMLHENWIWFIELTFTAPKGVLKHSRKGMRPSSIKIKFSEISNSFSSLYFQGNWWKRKLDSLNVGPECLMIVSQAVQKSNRSRPATQKLWPHQNLKRIIMIIKLNRVDWKVCNNSNHMLCKFCAWEVGVCQVFCYYQNHRCD